MTDAGALGLGVLVLIAALVLVLSRREMFAPKYPERKRVVVNTKDDQAISGVLWERNGEFVVLKSAAILRGSEKPIPIDGDTIIYRDNVSLVQVLHGAS